MALKVRLQAKHPGGVIVKKSSATRIIDTLRMNGSDGFLTACVTIYGEGNIYDVDLTAEDEPNTGIIVGEAGEPTDLAKDGDSTYSDNQKLKIMVPVPGDVFYCTAKTDTTVTYGAALQADGGMVEDSDWSATPTSANIHPLNIIGQGLEAITHQSSFTELMQVMKV